VNLLYLMAAVNQSDFGLGSEGLYVGRIWRPKMGPCLVKLDEGIVIDITSKQAPTLRDLFERADLVEFVGAAVGERVCSLAELAASSLEADVSEDKLHILAPNDFQSVKAAGVTFARSMVERVIEERAKGDHSKAADIRAQIADIIGGTLKDLIPGSDRAEDVKAVLMKEGLWSQYLEVGIGPDAEVFSKAQTLSAVGWGARVGLHPISTWNNPEPEIVLAVTSCGRVVGSTLGNDVNLRDVEGRSALLLSKAKDNNASASIGPFVRLFDDGFSMADVEQCEITLKITGDDGFNLEAVCSMDEISRKPMDLVKQTVDRHHQYPDGFMLYLGSMFAPIQDRDEEGQGFTHKVGDIVEISTPLLGILRNKVDLSTSCPPWTFGATSLMRNLSQRNLI
jgi:fumarylacetoacetate (FAA) hydrolase family protein